MTVRVRAHEAVSQGNEGGPPHGAIPTTEMAERVGENWHPVVRLRALPSRNSSPSQAVCIARPMISLAAPAIENRLQHRLSAPTLAVRNYQDLEVPGPMHPFNSFQLDVAGGRGS